MTFWKSQNYGDREKINGCQELVGTMNRQSTEGSETTLSDAIRVDTCHYTFVPVACETPSDPQPPTSLLGTTKDGSLASVSSTPGCSFPGSLISFLLPSPSLSHLRELLHNQVAYILTLCLGPMAIYRSDYTLRKRKYPGLWEITLHCL